jgi:hypothetical protein
MDFTQLIAQGTTHDFPTVIWVRGPDVSIYVRVGVVGIRTKAGPT